MWWSNFGYSVPLVRKVAMRLLAQQASSGAAERVNSEMGWIKNKKSNRFGDDTFERVAWCHHNLRLRRKFYTDTDATEVLYVSVELYMMI